MTRKILLATTAVAGSLLFSGCAGMFSGTTQSLTIKSNVEGANVELNGRTIGQTPLTAIIEKKKDLLIIVKKEGYHETSMPLNTSFDPMGLAGLFSYGSPLTTDIQRGTAYQLSPNYYHVELKKKD